MKIFVFSSHTRNSCWRGTTPLEKKTESFKVCYLVEGKPAWLPTLFFNHHSHFNAGFAGRASEHEVLRVAHITHPHGASTDEGLRLGRGKYGDLWGTVVREEGLGMFQIIFHVHADTHHNVTLEFPLKIGTWKTARLKIRADFHVIK